VTQHRRETRVTHEPDHGHRIGAGRDELAHRRMAKVVKVELASSLLVARQDLVGERDQPPPRVADVLEGPPVRGFG
jgi:hypothetical protein